MKVVSKSFSVGSKYKFLMEQARLVTTQICNRSDFLVGMFGGIPVSGCEMKTSILFDNDTLKCNNSASGVG